MDVSRSAQDDGMHVCQYTTLLTVGPGQWKYVGVGCVINTVSGVDMFGEMILPAAVA